MTEQNKNGALVTRPVKGSIVYAISDGWPPVPIASRVPCGPDVLVRYINHAVCR